MKTLTFYKKELLKQCMRKPAIALFPFYALYFKALIGWPFAVVVGSYLFFFYMYRAYKMDLLRYDKVVTIDDMKQVFRTKEWKLMLSQLHMKLEGGQHD